MNQEATSAGQEEARHQAGKLLAMVAGHVGVRIVEMGLRLGLVERLAEQPDGLSAEALAERTGLHPFYVDVWCRAALAADVLDAGDGTYRLAPHMATLLLDRDAPTYTGGTFTVLVQPEIFDQFASNLPTGEGTWWDRVSREFIRGVSGTGRAFYNRLIPAGLERVPGLAARLAEGAPVLELACGAGAGLVKMAAAYPGCTFVGVDGDAYSLELAQANVKEAGIEPRVELLHSTLEDFERKEAFDAAVINISMHEARDIEKVTANVHRSLRPGGWFAISDFPFPESTEGLRTVPGRVMSGIQLFEALIGDQLLPTGAFVDLLARQGFGEVDAFEITPMHVVIHGRR